ncbi:universal stress protein [Nocardioides houyundeii]|uniref:universal stress protein n=1 Tax=Nocardioides houyundeii TaxID=2045452 RepID=UPI000C7850A7|nr:universal stress protein [Nocardioides houyundeii]
MHVLIATDGSKQSLAAAKYLKSFVDPTKVDSVTVVAVIRPLAAVPFANDLAGQEQGPGSTSSFRAAAEGALAEIASTFDGWGPKVQRKIRSGSPANEILKLAKQLEAGLVVVASGSRGISDTVMLGSTAQRVQQYAPCPVLVVRPSPRRRGVKT